MVGIHNVEETSESRFISVARAPYIHRVANLINAGSSDTALDMAVVRGFVTSLKALGPSCENPIDMEYLARIQRVAIFAATDPTQGTMPVMFLS